MVDIQGKASAKTIINKKEFEFIFTDGVDIKDATQALADIHKHLVDLVKKQQEKLEEEKNSTEESTAEASESIDKT